jgi:soluble lytic murein transglycosylase-like protein
VAQRHRALLVRVSHYAWGLDAPVATFAGQVHQESGWRVDAVSRVGAQGLAQFMPTTTTWIGGLKPELAARQPFDPAWALQAMVTYDRWLFDRLPSRYALCDRTWAALRGYNGGLGHWQAEAKATGLGAPTRRQVDAACGKAKRAALHCRENLDYPARILQRHEPRYEAAGWGAGSCP